MTYVKIDERENHRERGDPAKILTLKEKQSCKSCGEEIEDDEFASLSLVNYSFYCGKGSCSPPVPNGIPDDMQRVSAHFQIKYVDEPNREDVRERLVEKYEKEGYDMPSEEELETMVDKRLENSDGIDLEEIGRPITSLGE